MKWIFLCLFLFSVFFVHFRGKARLPFFRQLFDHSTFVAPINALIYLFSKVDIRQAFLPTAEFQALKPLEEHWEIIREEAQNLLATDKIQATTKNNDAGFNSFFKAGWKRFYLKWYDAHHPSAIAFCPKTVALLRDIPCVKAAMFAELGPGGKLNPHRDPFAGSLRYHLGLLTPNDDRCFIEVNQQRYSWRDGQSVIFDETYVHWAYNGTDMGRVILFCDIERPMCNCWTQTLNRWLGKTAMTAAASPNEIGDSTGSINRLFRFVWTIGQYRRRLKHFSKPLYWLVKFGLILGTLAGILWI